MNLIKDTVAHAHLIKEELLCYEKPERFSLQGVRGVAREEKIEKVRVKVKWARKVTKK